MLDPTQLEPLFANASRAAMLGWVALLLGLLAQGLSAQGGVALRVSRALLTLGGRMIPVLLSLGYAALMLRWWGSSAGGFGSLEQVGKLFEARGLLLAGWVHYLAFDLWVGRWSIDALAAEPPAHGIVDWMGRLLMLPCLMLTFMFGPVGLLAFLALRQARRWSLGGRRQHAPRSAP
jgi:hypothetical protein